MTVSIRKSVIDIDEVKIDNVIVAEYLAGIPESQREEALIKAIGIGVLAGIKGEIAHFLYETEGELGKHLASLKTLYELREIRFKETSLKGEKAETDIMEALSDIQAAAGLNKDEIIDLSRKQGLLPRNKTGDVMVLVDGVDDCSIGFEVKLDKSVRLGLLDSRDPAAKTDTAIGQLIEMRANRKTDVNVIVFDEDSVDASVSSACKCGVRFIEGVGFIVIVSTRRADFSNLAVVYSISREMARAEIYKRPIDGKILTMIVERLLYLLNDYRSVKKEVNNIKKSAEKIETSLDKMTLYIKSTENYLKHFLKSGELSESELHNFYVAEKLPIDA